MTLPPEREIGRELAGAMHQSTGSYELVVAAIAAAALGFWIDTVIGTRPLLTIIFAVAGFIGAGYSLYLKYQAQMAAADTERTARRDGKRAASGVASPQGEHSPLVSEANGGLRANGASDTKQAGQI